MKLVVEEYLKPLLVGRDVDNIEDLWHLMNVNGYWRNGPISNNAISGVDMALWDIKGKLAKMPVYSLLGGKSRQAIPVYRHADGNSLGEVVENIERFYEEGYKYQRIQVGIYGGLADSMNTPPGSYPGEYFDAEKYVDDTLRLFEGVRAKVGFKVQLLHDSHERLSPIQAIQFAKELEKYRLFFLEDVLSPEQGEWFRILREQTSTPIAVGELFNNPKEWDYLISNRLIDFIRVHISQIGGLTPARKLAVLAEAFGVRTAWHGPSDVCPIGHAVNAHLGLVAHNTGIQEWTNIMDNPLLPEAFPGMPYVKNGYMYANSNPGLGIDINEKMLLSFPPKDEVTAWTQTRHVDGTICTP